MSDHSDYHSDKDYEDGHLRNFTLPAKMPLEDLISKYKGIYDISVIAFDNEKVDYLINKILRSEKSGTIGTRIASHDSSNVTLRRSRMTRERGSSNSETDNSDCVIVSETTANRFKTPQRTTRQTKTTDNRSGEVRRLSPLIKQTAKRRKAEDIDDSAKPGTLNSRQKLPPPAKVRQILDGVVHCELIDTKNFVNTDMMVSLQELCQRAKIKDVPEDPTDLLKSFKLILPRLSDTLVGENSQ